MTETKHKCGCVIDVCKSSLFGYTEMIPYFKKRCFKHRREGGKELLKSSSLTHVNERFK